MNCEKTVEVVLHDENTICSRECSDTIFGIVQYGLKNNIPKKLSHIPNVFIKCPVMGASNYYKIFFSHEKVNYLESEYYSLAHDTNNLFGCSSIKECPDNSISIIAEKMYSEAFKLTEKLNFPDLYRTWNYLPKITDSDISGNVRYKAFSFGRSEAFVHEFNKTNKIIYPASTAVGNVSDEISIFFLAFARKSMVAIENPRQTPAFNYPSKYGVRAPSFSRGIYLSHFSGFNLYISGTASIAGTESMHPGNIEKQCAETLENIRALISRDNLQKHGIQIALSLADIQRLVVYLKDDCDYNIVQNSLHKTFSKDAQIAYVKADLCRSDLLIEIEGII
ncbi:MAG: hypothetical protein HQM10_04895 [Candidatus Riflebacteria bacterium]|nr:hypothetical protein [Candidatus Riflebacteria bacterium]